MIMASNKIVIKDGIVCNNYIRVISEEDWSNIYTDTPDEIDLKLVNKSYKIQIKVYGFMNVTSKYVTIKEFPVKADNDDDFARNEAIELFNNIVNPYKYNG